MLAGRQVMQVGRPVDAGGRQVMLVGRPVDARKKPCGCWLGGKWCWREASDADGRQVMLAGGK